MVIVDASAPRGRPGRVQVHLVGDSELSAGGVGTAGTHGFGVAEAVELIRALGQLPSRLVLIGVEAGTLDAGRPLSPAVSARLNDAVQAALAAARVTAEPSPSS